MSDNKLFDKIVSNINAVAEAEKITKAIMAELPVDILRLLIENKDIQHVNRLIGKLTPMNKRSAIIFFRHFVPFVEEKAKNGDHISFKGLMREKEANKRWSLIEEFLASEQPNFWAWLEVNTTTEQKAPDLVKNFDRALTQLLEGNEKRGAAPVSPVVAVEHFMSMIDPSVVLGVLEANRIAEEQKLKLVA